MSKEDLQIKVEVKPLVPLRKAREATLEAKNGQIELNGLGFIVAKDGLRGMVTLDSLLFKGVVFEVRGRHTKIDPVANIPYKREQIYLEPGEPAIISRGRKKITITNGSSPNPNQESSVGARPLSPKTTLSAAVSLEIPTSDQT